MTSNQKIRTGGLIATLVALLFVSQVSVANAQQIADFSVAGNGKVTVQWDTTDSANPYNFRIYEGMIDTGTQFAGYLCSSSCGSFSALFGSIASTTATSFTYNLANVVSTDGDYYIKITKGTEDFYIGNITRENGVYFTNVEIDVGQVLSQNTRFTELDVSGTASNTVITVDFNIDTNDFTSETRPDTVQFYISSTDSTQVALRQTLNLPLVTGTSSRTVTITPAYYLTEYEGLTELPDGTYTVWLKFWNFSNQSYTLPAEITANFVISGGLVTTSTVVSQSQGLFPQSPTYQECSLTALSGCLTNAISYLFYPSTQSISNITSISDTLSTKFPFAYAYDFQQSINSLYSGEQTQSATISYDFNGLGELTLISEEMLSDVPLSGTIRTTLSYLLWIMFAFLMYRRTLKIFNTNPV